MMRPAKNVPIESPMLGPAAVSAVPSQAFPGGAVSTTQDMAALEANPQESPCRKRPTYSPVDVSANEKQRLAAAPKRSAKSTTGLRPKKFESRAKKSSVATHPPK